MRDKIIYSISIVFFSCMLVMHVINKLIGGTSYLSWIITDLILIGILVFLRITRAIKLEVVIALFLYAWSVYAIMLYTHDTVTYCISFAYSIMVFLKNLKVKPIIVIGFSIFQVTLTAAVFMVKSENTDKLFYCLFLTSFLCLLHYYIYYDEYKIETQVKDKYQLTKQEISIINEVLKPNPGNKRIASDLCMSEENVKRILGNIYIKFDILKGGSKKTELVAKLARLGYKC